jgi:hypothetical protein
LSVRNRYDALAPWYHLVYQDWESVIARQGEALSALIVNGLEPIKAPRDALANKPLERVGMSGC